MFFPFSTSVSSLEKSPILNNIFPPLDPNFAASIHLEFLVPLHGRHWQSCICVVGLALLSSPESLLYILQLEKFGFFCVILPLPPVKQSFLAVLSVTSASLSLSCVTFWQFCMPYWIIFLVLCSWLKHLPEPSHLSTALVEIYMGRLCFCHFLFPGGRASQRKNMVFDRARVYERLYVCPATWRSEIKLSQHTTERWNALQMSNLICYTGTLLE